MNCPARSAKWLSLKLQKHSARQGGLGAPEYHTCFNQFDLRNLQSVIPGIGCHIKPVILVCGAVGEIKGLRLESCRKDNVGLRISRVKVNPVIGTLRG